MNSPSSLSFRLLALMLGLAIRSAAMSVCPDSAFVALDSGRPLDPIEGIWQFPDDGARILITRATSTSFSISLLSSPRLDICPGIEIGKAVVTPTDGVYDASLRASALGLKRLKNTSIEIKVNDNGTLSLRPYNDKMRISFSRWFTRLFRLNIISPDKTSHLVGPRKVYPLPSSYKPCL